MSTASTSVDAMAAWHAMNPECRPISLTTAMPLFAPVASTCAPRITSTAAENAALEAEAPVDEVDVVVDRLRDADDADEQIAPADLVDELHRAAQRPVAPDDEQDADVELVEAVDHLARVLIAARRPEGRAAAVVDVGDRPTPSA